jgi:hypothetical protein
VKKTLWPMPSQAASLDDPVQDHVAVAGHDELDVLDLLQDFLAAAQEVLGSLLHGDASEEQHDLVVAAWARPVAAQGRLVRPLRSTPL